MANGLNETCAESASRTEGISPRQTEDFEENLAEAVYEGLSWAGSVVAPLLDMYVQDAQTFEIGLRRTRLDIQDCGKLEKGLEKAFGFGAKVVEIKILRILHSRLGVNKIIEADFKFTDELRIARELHNSRLQTRGMK